ncbi:HAD family hydrolase [Cohnella algarum]|uniref:HAD family hydrolase n=1 Tax=Cohnella algarum TaxID=2044859 RepID=UPI0019678CF7|nr:HAD family hydrolase [Cohnella algarum]MBN2983787.1 HAD family hydrolase [Cohnella algarum]
MREKKALVVFLDCGDTLVDEGSEVKDENGIVLRADLIPGAKETVRTLYERGYTLALVADGAAQSFKNTLTQNGIYDYFDAMIYSETIKATKPDRRMFKAAVGALDLGEADYGRIVMVGNNLSRDVKGARAFGIASVFLAWTPRYPHVPADESERPDYVIHEPLELLELVERLNEAVEGRLMQIDRQRR